MQADTLAFIAQACEMHMKFEVHGMPKRRMPCVRRSILLFPTITADVKQTTRFFFGETPQQTEGKPATHSA
jgi:hypothetical protein